MPLTMMNGDLLDFTDYSPPPANFDAAVGKPLVLSCSRKPSVKG